MNDAQLKRLQALIDEAGMNHKSVSKAAGVSDSTVNSWFKKARRSDPSSENLAAVAKVLNTTVHFILHGHEPDAVRIPVLGIASAGEGWQAIDPVRESDLRFDLTRADAMAVEIRGNSMHPVYRHGDYIVCSGRHVANFDNLIGQDCVVMTKDGLGLIKILQRGRTRGRYSLKSYNFTTPDVEDVDLAWVAPIEWIKRGR